MGSRRPDGHGKRTFWTLMLWLVLLKINAARIAFANRRAWVAVSGESLGSRPARGVAPGLISPPGPPEEN